MSIQQVGGGNVVSGDQVPAIVVTAAALASSAPDPAPTPVTPPTPLPATTASAPSTPKVGDYWVDMS